MSHDRTERPSASAPSPAPPAPTATSAKAGTKGNAAAPAAPASAGPPPPPDAPPALPGFGRTSGFTAASRAAAHVIQRQASGAAGPGSGATAAMDQATAGSGGAVPHRAAMEQSFGQDFGSVRSYTGQGASMGDLGANAAARGETVAFASPSPSRELVAHELTHVVQQRAAGDGVQMQDATSAPGSASEREAEALAPRAAAGERVTVTARPEAAVQRDTTPGGSPPPPTSGAIVEEEVPESSTVDALANHRVHTIWTLAKNQANRSRIIDIAIAHNLLDGLFLAITELESTSWMRACSDAQLTALLGLLPQPADNQAFTVVWWLWGDGTTRGAGVGRAMFDKLYTSRILRPNQDEALAGTPPTQVGSGANRRQDRWIFEPRDPDDNAMRRFLTGVQLLPRGNVNAANIVFAPNKLHQQRPLAPAGAPWTTTQTEAMTTSLYSPSIPLVVIYAGASGATQASVVTDTVIPTMTDGGGRAVGGTAGGPNLTRFLNHARHEVGHAIGDRQLAGTPESGNEFARQWGQWTPINATTFASAMWSATGTRDATFPTASGSSVQHVSASAARAWFMGCIENEAEPPGNAVTAIAATTKDKAAALGQAYADQELTKYFGAVFERKSFSLSGFKAGAYEFPGWQPAHPDRVHAYISRAQSPGFMSYAKTVWQAMHAAVSWYSLASFHETFAELYTHKYSGGRIPAIANNGRNPADFFQLLEASSDSGPIPGGPTPMNPAAGTPATPTPAPTTPPTTPTTPAPTGTPLPTP